MQNNRDGSHKHDDCEENEDAESMCALKEPSSKRRTNDNSCRFTIMHVYKKFRAAHIQNTSEAAVDQRLDLPLAWQIKKFCYWMALLLNKSKLDSFMVGTIHEAQ